MIGYLMSPGGHCVPVVDGLTIGRVNDCDLRVADPKASRHHARLIVEASVVEIEDLGSSNGTLVNGRPVRKAMLRPGDVIQVGTTLITYQHEAAGGAPGDGAVGAPWTDGVEAGGQAAAREVIEFVDERIEVARTVTMGRPAREAGLTARRGVAPRRPVRGPLGDDLRQMAGPHRFLVVLLVVVVTAALGYAVSRLVGG